MTNGTRLTGAALVLLGALVSCGAGNGTAAGPAAPEPSAWTAQARSASPAPHTGATVSRCRSAELSAAVGRMDPGAGRRNFPVVLTNVSSRTCTLYGYPGAAFVDAAGGQLGRDPKRTPGDPATVTLAPGAAAWAGLRYSSPGVSGARAATPAALLVTPPDERDPLGVPWKGGAVPVSGNASSVFLTTLEPGAGP